MLDLNKIKENIDAGISDGLLKAKYSADLENYVNITKLALKIQEVFYITKCKTYYEETKVISKFIDDFIKENYEIKESI